MSAPLYAEPRVCTGCDVELPDEYLADACLTCIALQDGEPLPERQGRDAWAP